MDFIAAVVLAESFLQVLLFEKREIDGVAGEEKHHPNGEKIRIYWPYFNKKGKSFIKTAIVWADMRFSIP